MFEMNNNNKKLFLNRLYLAFSRSTLIFFISLQTVRETPPSSNLFHSIFAQTPETKATMCQSSDRRHEFPSKRPTLPQTHWESTTSRCSTGSTTNIKLRTGSEDHRSKILFSFCISTIKLNCWESRGNLKKTLSVSTWKQLFYTRGVDELVESVFRTSLSSFLNASDCGPGERDGLTCTQSVCLPAEWTLGSAASPPSSLVLYVVSHRIMDMMLWFLLRLSLSIVHILKDWIHLFDLFY